MMEPDDHRAEVEAWRQQRYERLRADIGWLTLSGLAWLGPGANVVGSDPDSDVVLPAGPPRAGTVVVDEDGVQASGAFRHGGVPVEALRLVSDVEGEPTLLELDDLRICLIERGGRLALRTWDLASPARRSFAGIDHWPVDPRWRIQARFEPAAANRTIAVPDVLGTVEEEASPGDVVFEADGASHRLQALPGGEAGELWLVFGDATNGVETYRGGRFLYTDAPGPDGRVTVDFNRAYNPPCVFSPYATCPLPWDANRLTIRVEAGERLYGPPH